MTDVTEEYHPFTLVRIVAGGKRGPKVGRQAQMTAMESWICSQCPRRVKLTG